MDGRTGLDRLQAHYKWKFRLDGIRLGECRAEPAHKILARFGSVELFDDCPFNAELASRVAVRIHATNTFGELIPMSVRPRWLSPSICFLTTAAMFALVSAGVPPGQPAGQRRVRNCRPNEERGWSS